MLDSLIVAPSRRESLERLTAACEKNVQALASFLEPRGISPVAAAQYRLGFVSDDIPGYERFAGMMSLPYCTPSGVVSVKFRRLEGEGPKYDSPSGQHARLYGVASFQSKGDTIAICEGELDSIVCSTVVGVPAVGSPGTTWLDHWPRCFADFERVLIVADNDEKEDGSNPGLKHAKSVQKSMPNSQIITPPKGLDLNDWVLRDGAEVVRKAMAL